MRCLFLTLVNFVIMCQPIWLPYILAESPRKVSTYECIGIYWQPESDTRGAECSVRYREHRGKTWQQALPLWYDARNAEYRGSIVGLRPESIYDIRLSLHGTDNSVQLQAETWPEEKPVGRTVYLKPGTHRETLVIRQGGRPEAFVLVTARKGETVTIDVANKQDYCVDIQASYVILRGLILKGAKKDGIRLGNVHDVSIEQCDISGWGREESSGFGVNFDSGIKSNATDLERIVIQRNKIHHPRTDANNWTEKGHLARQPYHPVGAQAISWANNRGNHVIRYNAFYSDDAHRFNDGIGWKANSSKLGFPGADSDVYSNVVSHCWDDGLEIEGGGCNVRVWGNYIDQTMVGIATCVCSVGPLYVFRNVFAQSHWADYPNGNTDAMIKTGHIQRKVLNRGYFAKVGEVKAGDSGQQYWFHNTLLQPLPAERRRLTLGALTAVLAVGKAKQITEFVSHNNIWHVCHPTDQEMVNRTCIHTGTLSETNRFDYDLYNGTLDEVYPNAEPHGIRGIPVYLPDSGPESGRNGYYQLDPSSPGYDAGKRIPNFNDDFLDRGPDMGAHENGSKRLEFGIDAYLKNGMHE